MATVMQPEMRRPPSDLQQEEGREATPKKSPALILLQEVQEGLEVLERPARPLFLSALSGGLDVGFSLFLMAVMWTRAENGVSPVALELLLANMYAVGFIFVVLGRSELFTEQTTLAVLPYLNRRAPLKSLLRLWVLVYVGNLLGAAGFAALTVVTGPALGVIDARAFAYIAQRMVEHSALAIFLSAVLAGWLMGLLSWLVAAGRDTISQIVMVWLITTVIGFTNLHHVILGSTEVLAGLFSGQGIGLADFGYFLVWTTLGNMVGGTIFVALIKHGHASPESVRQGKATTTP